MASRRSRRANELTDQDREALFEDAVQNMPDTYVQCRDFGHSWRPFAASWDQDARAYDQTLRCVRCKLKRHRLIDSHGMNVSASYDYNDLPGYLMPKGAGLMDVQHRAAIRLAQLRRTLHVKEA